MESSTSKMDQFKNINHQMHTICTTGFERLRDLWDEMFDAKLCLDQAKQLPDQMMAFFDEIYQESNQLREIFVAEIAELRQEALELQRQLGEQQQGLPAAIESRSLFEQRSALDESLNQMQQKLSQRHVIIDEYLLEMETLCEELSVEPRTLPKDPLPTERELVEFRSYLDYLIAKKMQRQEDIGNLRRETKKLISCLQTISITKEQHRLLNARKFPPTRENMHDLRMLHEEVAAQYESLKQHIDDTRRKLERLWQCLETDPAIVQKFGKLTSYTQTTFDKLSAELDRCDALRRENMEAFVERTRCYIMEWWERCMKSQDERAQFTMFHSKDYNEGLLKLHELELDCLKQFYGENEQIFQMVLQRQEIWNRKLALENKSNDPTRYHNRGAKLLQEEKERRRISTQLPKIEAKLLEVCKQYEEEHGRKFTVYGTPVQELIKQQWKQLEKYQKWSARKKANGVLGVPTVGSTSYRVADFDGQMLLHYEQQSVAASDRQWFDAKPSLTPLVTASATKSGPWLKRKLATPTNSKKHAKRSLLPELNSPSVVIISSAESTIMQESDCYEDIRTYFDNNVPNRSSLVSRRTRLHQ
uniref:Uncharacterized protein n=1 Tax=Anopheles arabiensis TaxID=7173 RepID=A0A182I9G5_ANOAR